MRLSNDVEIIKDVTTDITLSEDHSTRRNGNVLEFEQKLKKSLYLDVIGTKLSDSKNCIDG